MATKNEVATQNSGTPAPKQKTFDVALMEKLESVRSWENA